MGQGEGKKPHFLKGGSLAGGEKKTDQEVAPCGLLFQRNGCFCARGGGGGGWKMMLNTKKVFFGGGFAREKIKRSGRGSSAEKNGSCSKKGVLLLKGRKGSARRGRKLFGKLQNL